MASYYRRNNGTYCIRVSRGKPGGKQDLVSTTYKQPKGISASAEERGAKEFAALFEASVHNGLFTPGRKQKVEQINPFGLTLADFIQKHFGIIIVSVLLYVAAIALYYIFIGIVIIAAIVGTVITLKNYILELKNAISNYKNASAPTNWKLPVFFYRWFKISWESLKGCWKNNINSIKASFQSGSAFRFISIRRWFYWILALSVAVFGALATLFILELHLLIATFITSILLYFVIEFVVIMAAAGFAFSLFAVFKYYFSEFKNRPTDTGAGSLARYICKHGYKDIFSMIKLLWQNSNSVLFQSKAQICPFNLLSIKKL